MIFKIGTLAPSMLAKNRLNFPDDNFLTYRTRTHTKYFQSIGSDIFMIAETLEIDSIPVRSLKVAKFTVYSVTLKVAKTNRTIIMPIFGRISNFGVP